MGHIKKGVLLGFLGLLLSLSPILSADCKTCGVTTLQQYSESPQIRNARVGVDVYFGPSYNYPYYYRPNYQSPYYYPPYYYRYYYYPYYPYYYYWW